MSDPSADAYAPEREAWVTLAAIDGLGPVAFDALIARYGQARAVLDDASRPGAVGRLLETPAVDPSAGRAARRPLTVGVATAIAAAAADPETLLAGWRRSGVRVVTAEEPTYPRRLRTIALPPRLLFVTGDVGALDRPRAVAVVGTRRATAVGRHTAGHIAVALVGAGAAVVSGLAMGIDGVAHEATLRAGGTTVAVIGGGHARLSPTVHARLADAIVRAGGAVVSEHMPDVEPSAGTFPRRNRIISGLTDATVVVQAPARSGALITASWALEQGRGCYLVPGGIGDVAAAGCLAFLREYPNEARIVAGVPQLIADLGFVDTGAAPGLASAPSDAIVAAALESLGRTEARVAGALLAGRTTVDELVAVTDLPVATVLATLALLDRRGLVAGVHGRYRPAGGLLGGVRLPRAG